MDDGEWHRAKIIEIEESLAFVFLGDHGDDDNVSLDKIKILEPQFRRLPAQVRTSRNFKSFTLSKIVPKSYPLDPLYRPRLNSCN